jgi:hypothetical protein
VSADPWLRRRAELGALALVTLTGLALRLHN